MTNARCFAYLPVLVCLLSTPAIAGSKKPCPYFTDLLRQSMASVKKKQVVHPELIIEFPNGGRSSEKGSDDKVNVVRSAIYEVDNFLDGEIKVPSRLKIRILPKGDTAISFDQVEINEMAIHISIPYSENDLQKHPKFIRHIIQHEYGHSLFMENLREKAPQFFSQYEKFSKSYDEAWPGITSQIEELTKKMSALTKELPSLDYASKESAEINARIDSINKTLEELSYRKIELDIGQAHFRKIRSSYSELFSDAVAVAVANDGEIITKTFYFSGIKQKTQIASRKARDFTARYPLEDWKHEAPHTLLSPARSHIWKYYLSNPLYAKNKAEVLERVLNAIGSEIETRGMNRSLWDLTPRKINERLIDAIDREFVADRAKGYP